MSLKSSHPLSSVPSPQETQEQSMSSEQFIIIVHLSLRTFLLLYEQMMLWVMCSYSTQDCQSVALDDSNDDDGGHHGHGNYSGYSYKAAVPDNDDKSSSK